MDSIDKNTLNKLATQIVAAYVSKNIVQTDNVPALINSVYNALKSLGQSEQTQTKPVELKPAVPVKKSVTPDYIICLEDGKKLKMLKRHLSSTYGLTPNEYRTKWGLPSDYPMVCPNYAKTRSVMAVTIGLGTKSRKKKA